VRSLWLVGYSAPATISVSSPAKERVKELAARLGA